MMAEPQRPRRGDSEEDILEQQKRFFAQLAQKNANKDNAGDNRPNSSSHSAPTNATEAEEVEGKLKGLGLTDEDPPSKEVLQDVTEREVGYAVAYPPRLAEKRPFPPALAVEHTKDGHNEEKSTVKKRSIFALNMQRQKAPSHPIMVSEGPMPSRDVNTFSALVDGSGVGSSAVASEIHKENLTIVSSMTNEQLTAERKSLLASLDPGTIAFLQSVRQRPKHNNSHTDIVPPVKPAEGMQTDCEPGRWPNMSVVEDRKLEWTQSPNADDKAQTVGLPARFNFEGDIVDRLADLSPNLGLHHHGEEPQAAGYTLDELLHISRSSLVPQRALALHTLAKILAKCHNGHYDECLDRPLIPLLLDAGLVHVLRWALDDGTPVGIAAAVEALAGLVVCPADEAFLDLTFSWHLGERSPRLGPGPFAKDGQELTDVEVVKADIIEGLIRMHLLVRMRYILELCRPTATVVQRVLDILIRVARHSPWAAEQILGCPRLLPTISGEFLPKSWKDPGTGPIADVYGVPIASALKLFRVLASVSKDLCRKMQAHVQVSFFLRYLSDNSAQLSLESLRTWTVFLANGFTTDFISESFPLLFRQLQYFNEVPVGSGNPAHRFDCDFGSALFQCLGTGLSATSHRDTEEKVHHLGWALTPTTLFVQAWIRRLTTSSESATISELSIIGRAIILVAWALDASYPEKCLETHNLVENCLLPFLRSAAFDKLLARLRANSSLNCKEKVFGERCPPSLPSLGSLLLNGQLSPVLREGTAVNFLTHLVNALNLFAKRDSEIAAQLRSTLTERESLVSYIRESVSAINHGATLIDHWFSRHETHLLHSLVELATLQGADDSATYHRVCLSLPCRLQCGDEAVALRLLELSFDQHFLRDWYGADFSKLQTIRQHYVNCFLALIEDAKVSRSNWDREHSLVFYGEGRTFFPVDFLYAPIWFSYLDGDISESDPELPGRVVGVLEWIGFLLHRRPASVSSIIPPETHVCKISSVFLVGNDIFLLPSVRETLRVILQELSTAGVFQRTRFEAPNKVDGIASFHDYFLKLLEHFEATSYGDLLFGSLLLTLVRQRHNKELRKLLWTEHTPCLRLLRVPIPNLLVPVRDFLVPLEDDDRLLGAYFSCLVSGAIQSKFCPVLYLFTIHHLHHFLFAGQNHLNLRRGMLLHLLRSSDQEWYGHLLRYGGVDLTADHGFQVLAELTEEVRAVVTKFYVSFI